MCFSSFRVYAGCAVALLLGGCERPAATFDSYVLSLSWSPQYCAGERGGGSPECDGSRSYGFVLHGLWPEAVQESDSQHCLGPSFDAASITGELRDAMPGDRLIEHEWATHGTCTGMSQEAYFRTALRAYRMVNIPAAFKAPAAREETTPAAVRQQFAETNPDFPADAFALKDEGRFLAEVRVCLTTDLKPRACDRPGDTRNVSIVVRAVR